MPTLNLHIGHMKTGSTWLQAAFRAGRDRLERAGIRYPLVGSEAKGVGQDYAIPTGNGSDLVEEPAKIAAKLARAVPDATSHALFSSELIFNRLAAQNDLRPLVAAARAHGFESVRMLLFTRAPLPLAASLWQQRVKGWEGERRDLDTWVTERFRTPMRSAEFVALADATDGVELTLHNYDAHRSDLLAPVECWLGLEAGTLERPEAERVNRSLTRAETALQLALNRALGPSREVFAVRLSNRLPEIASDPPRISTTAARQALEHNAAALDALDARLPEGESLARDVPPEAPAAPLALSEAQMAVIAEGFAAYIDPPLPLRARRAARILRDRLAGRRPRR